MTVYPSIMGNSQEEINTLFKNLKKVSREFHLDIADGKFVPNTSLLFKFKLRKGYKYNAHLMIVEPEKWIQDNAKKVNLCIVPVETLKNIPKFIKSMKLRKEKIAFSLNPETNVSELKQYEKDIHTILILTVHPGFYGAKFLKAPLKKIEQIKQLNPKIKIIVDGGMNPETVKLTKGADHIVSGSFITKSEDPKRSMRQLRKAIKENK